MIEVDRFGAFTVNGVGLTGTPFPLSITVSEKDGIWTARGTAIRAVDIVDTLAGSAGLFAAVLNIGQNAWLGPGFVPVAAGEIAAHQDVPAEVHDISWTGTDRNELLALRWADLGRLFGGWSLYEVDVIDLGDDLAGFNADEFALTAKTCDPGTGPAAAAGGSRSLVLRS